MNTFPKEKNITKNSRGSSYIIPKFLVTINC